MTQSNIYDGAFMRKWEAIEYIQKTSPSQVLAQILNTPMLIEDSSNVLLL